MSHQQTEMSSKSFGALPREKLCRVLMNKEHNSEFNFTKTAESGWLTSSGSQPPWQHGQQWTEPRPTTTALRTFGIQERLPAPL